MFGNAAVYYMRAVLIYGIIIGLLGGVIGGCAIPYVAKHVRVEWVK